MRAPLAIFAGIVALLGGVALAVLLENERTLPAEDSKSLPGEPRVEIVSPRNGSRHEAHSVVVRVRLENFRLAPRRFESEPRLGEGHIRFALNRVPDCVEPEKLKKAEESPLGRGRLVGAPYDFAKYSGPNGVLARRIGSSGNYSPGTRPEVYYDDLPVGFYRLVVTLARNNGATTPYHAVTNFQVLPGPEQELRPCPPGKVTSAPAAAFD